MAKSQKIPEAGWYRRKSQSPKAAQDFKGVNIILYAAHFPHYVTHIG